MLVLSSSYPWHQIDALLLSTQGTPNVEGANNTQVQQEIPVFRLNFCEFT